LVPTIDGVTHHFNNVGLYDALFVMEKKPIGFTPMQWQCRLACGEHANPSLPHSLENGSGFRRARPLYLRGGSTIK
jgi:hypothetical protein